MANEESTIKKLLPLTSVLLLLAVVYAGYIVYSRWSEGRGYESQRKEKEVADAKKVSELYGDRVKIHSFSAESGSLAKGQSTNVCYGVANAKTVEITPKPAQETWPSLSRCVKVEPDETTTYILSAKDAQGHEEKAQITVEVHRLKVSGH